MVFLFFPGIVFVLAVGVLSCLDWWKKHVAVSQVFFWGIMVNRGELYKCALL